MTKRPVLRLLRDESGRIAFLFGAWGAVDRDTAIEQIESGWCRYTLTLRGGILAELRPIETADGRDILATDAAGHRVAVEGSALLHL